MNWRLTLLWAYLFLCLGLAIAVFGPALPAFRADFGVPIAAAGVVFTFHSLGYLASNVLVGPLADRYGRRIVTAGGAAVLSLGLVLAALSQSWPVFLATMIVNGLGFCAVDVGLNAALGDATGSAGARSRAMNLLHSAFPIGTLAGPAALSLAWQLNAGWRATLLAIAGATLLALVPLSLRLPWPAQHGAPTPSLAPEPVPIRLAVPVSASVSEPNAAPLSVFAANGHVDSARLASSGVSDGRTQQDRSTGKPLAGRIKQASLLHALREPHLAQLAGLQALYVCVEVGLSGWIATDLVDRFGAGEGAGALATSAFWGGFLIGRPLVAWISHRANPARLLPWMVGLALLTAAGSVLVTGPVAASVAYALTAIAIAGIFPTVMALALQDRPGDAGAVTSLITAAASVGGLLWPWLIGVVAGGWGLHLAMALASAPLLPMLPLTVVVARNQTP